LVVHQENIPHFVIFVVVVVVVVTCLLDNLFIVYVVDYHTSTGNYRIHEFDWLKSMLTAIEIFPSRLCAFCGEKVATELKYKNIHSFLLFCSSFMCQNACEKIVKDEQTLANLVHLTAVRKQNVS